MRQVLTPNPTFLLAACLALLPAATSAQDDEGKSSSTAATSQESASLSSDKPALSAQEKAEARRIARLEREKEAERQRIERERLCVIKPVMTDAEIAQCKEVWR